MPISDMLSSHEDRLNVGTLTTAIETLVMCAAHCNICADAYLEEEADLTRCIRACVDCADECERHAEQYQHCRQCAVACRRCVQACEALLEHTRTSVPYRGPGMTPRGLILLGLLLVAWTAVPVSPRTGTAAAVCVGQHRVRFDPGITMTEGRSTLSTQDGRITCRGRIGGRDVTGLEGTFRQGGVLVGDCVTTPLTAIGAGQQIVLER